MCKNICQVNLGAVHRIVGIVTQGNSDGADWVTQYTLSYSDDDVNFIDYPAQSTTPRVCCYIVSKIAYEIFIQHLRVQLQLSLMEVRIVSDTFHGVVWFRLTTIMMVRTKSAHNC